MISNAGSRFVCTLVFSVGVGLIGTMPAFSAPRWIEQGPGPILNGPTTVVAGNNPVAGAINRVVVSGTNPDLVYVGTVNGGIWKTSNATTESPNWSPLTDRRLPGLSINSLALSPVDPNILFAGTGSTSSYGVLYESEISGSPGFGVARSTDGGRTWAVLAQDTFAGRRINSIVPTALDGGRVVLAATQRDSPPGKTSPWRGVGGGGVFRSTDMGDSFVRLSGNGSSGLPDQEVSDLVADPGNRNRFYAGVPAMLGPVSGVVPTGREGVYRSDDGGVTWAPVNMGLTGLDGSVRILLAIHNNNLRRTNVVYAAILSQKSGLVGVFRSENLGVTWTDLGVPEPNIFSLASQAITKGALAADPTDPNVVFIAGDIGGLDSELMVLGQDWRGDASLLPASPWSRVDLAEAHGTVPHGDSRQMVFDPHGDLLETNDGGIYRLIDPNNRVGQRKWVSVNGDIRPTEFHSIAYDSVSGIVFGGAQDNGVPVQSAPGEFTWVDLPFFGSNGDGGNVAVDVDQTAHPGTSIRYTNTGQFNGFNRSTWLATNTMVGGPTPVQLKITSGDGIGKTLEEFDPQSVQFYQVYVLNAIDPSRMLIGTTNLYESLDRGDTLTNLGSTGNNVGTSTHGSPGLSGASPMAYGGHLAGLPYRDVFYVGAGSLILHRVTFGGPITRLTGYPGGVVVGLVIDPQNYRHVFVLDLANLANHVWGSFDEGASWTDLTGNLSTLTLSIRVLEFVRPAAQGKPPVLVAGGLGGVFQLRDPQTAGAQWRALNMGLPHTLVLDLHYDANDDVLVAGSLGRGAWTLTGFFGSK